MKRLCGESRSREYIKSEKKKGKRYAEVTLGDTLLIHTYFFQTKYIAYQDIKQVYMRVAGGEFGEFPIDEYSLIVIDREEREHVLHVERGEYVKGVLETIAERYPDIFVGKY